jgi:hypothetical protein
MLSLRSMIHDFVVRGPTGCAGKGLGGPEKIGGSIPNPLW